ncbi:hypothetical protein VVR12_07675 [Rothia sp. LK2588]|uniref:hypothetical protein n=1 Tax=Rothia sp. LK2588 TaxID=3114369 RepID=UPI0034CE4242
MYPSKSSLSVISLACVAALALGGCSAGSDTSAQDAGGKSSASSQASGSANSSSSAQSSASAGQSGAASSESPSATPSPSADTSAKIFDGKRYVALYGAPGNPALGVLGEQGPAESVTRVKQLVEQYQPHSQEKVVPAFEVIATTASSVPGADGDYSDEASVESLKPLVDEAEKNGVYVVLDIQPGRSDFLSQIKRYEELLKRPNVGVGIDPEWRLLPWQVHLEQIGSVTAEEVNQSLAYLAELTAKNGLPQKMVVVHQFTQSMISNRELLDVSHPELALTLHADGHGTPGLKKDTYASLLQGLSPQIKPSWKNFYDEDTPMLTPAETYALTPKPWVVTYQ